MKHQIPSKLYCDCNNGVGGFHFESVALKQTRICYLMPSVRRPSTQEIPKMMVKVYGKYIILEIKSTPAYMCGTITFGVRSFQGSSFGSKFTLESS